MTRSLFPVNGNWSAWSDWSTCSVTCSVGVETRSRSCDNPPPQFNGHACVGNVTDTQPCNDSVCPCEWSIKSIPLFFNRSIRWIILEKTGRNSYSVFFFQCLFKMFAKTWVRNALPIRTCFVQRTIPMASNYVLLPVAPAVRATFNSNIRFSDASNNYILQGLKSVLNLTLPTESSPSKQAHLFTTLCFNFFFHWWDSINFPALVWEAATQSYICLPLSLV